MRSTVGKIKSAQQDEDWLQTFYLTVVGGYGKNKDAKGTAKGKAYLAPDQQSIVIVVKFKDDVDY